MSPTALKNRIPRYTGTQRALLRKIHAYKENKRYAEFMHSTRPPKDDPVYKELTRLIQTHEEMTGHRRAVQEWKAAIGRLLTRTMREDEYVNWAREYKIKLDN